MISIVFGWRCSSHQIPYQRQYYMVLTRSDDGPNLKSVSTGQGTGSQQETNILNFTKFHH